MMLAHGDLLFCRRFCLDPIWSVKTNVVVRDPIIDHRLIVVGIMHECRVHSAYRGVIVESSSRPVTSDKAGSEIAEPIVDPAIEPNCPSPIPCVPDVTTVFETP